MIRNALLMALLAQGADAGKIGLCCMECTQTTYQPLANVSSWAYRYSLFVDDADTAAWLAKSGIEFVPHLAHKQVPLPSGDSCHFDKAPFCTDDQLDSALAYNAGGATIDYLMGWNEAYDKGNKKAVFKYIAPPDAATYWRTYVQGMATRNKVKLVSPTTGVSPNKISWMGSMILECYAQLSQGCDVDTIAAFSVHDYKCSQTYWETNYGTNGVFQTKLTQFLSANSTGAGKDWKSYVASKPIWVTETNCNGDSGWPSTGPVDRTEQCLRISGQKADQDCGEYGKCGKGSIATMQSMDTIERVSWWNTWNQNAKGRAKTANAMLVDEDGTLYPAGRAISNGFLTTTDCSQ
jgi:hypothetical protein